ncbi:hypothetical protein EJB05_26036, partial [Eragrostis curvula]
MIGGVRQDDVGRQTCDALEREAALLRGKRDFRSVNDIERVGDNSSSHKDYYGDNDIDMGLEESIADMDSPTRNEQRSKVQRCVETDNVYAQSSHMIRKETDIRSRPPADEGYAGADLPRDDLILNKVKKLKSSVQTNNLHGGRT